MKKYLKEIVVLIIQLLMFYVFPLTAGPTDTMGMVLLIILATFILSIIIGSISKEKIKYFYPIIVSILFIPSIFIYYNESALIHFVWYLVDSIIGLIIGVAIYKIANKKIIKIIIGVLLLLALIFFAIDYSRVQNDDIIDYIVEKGPQTSSNPFDDVEANKDSNRIPEKVIIKVDENTITPTSVSITITDNNENHYGWGVEFRVQQKVNGEWKDLKYVYDNLSWIDIAYELGKNNQITQKLDIEKYYGKLNNGIYRIVKPVYDNEYIDIYSNEFEIK